MVISIAMLVDQRVSHIISVYPQLPPTAHSPFSARRISPEQLSQWDDPLSPKRTKRHGECLDMCPMDPYGTKAEGCCCILQTWVVSCRIITPHLQPTQMRNNMNILWHFWLPFGRDPHNYSIRSHHQPRRIWLRPCLFMSQNRQQLSILNQLRFWILLIHVNRHHTCLRFRHSVYIHTLYSSHIQV